MKKLLLLLACCAAASGAGAQTAAPARDLVQEGVQLYDAGQYEQALAKYRQALAAEPDSPVAQAELALTYNALGRNAEAKAVCEQVLKRHPDAGPTVYVTYGNSLDALGKAKEAEQAYRRGLKLSPGSYALYYNLGITQVGERRYPEAVASFRQAVVLNPAHASSHLSLGVVQQGLAARVPAVLALARFLALEPQGPRAAQRLPLLLQAMRQGVSQPDSSHINIAISSRALDEANRKRASPDNFGSVEMALALVAAADKAPTEAERFIKQFDSLCKLLAELQPKTNASPGFTWTYYAPYFIEMQHKGFVPAFAYLAFASQPASAAQAQQWLAAHPAETQVFQEWSKTYVWPRIMP